MRQTVMTAREIRAHLGERIDAAHFGQEVTVVTKNGAPRAVLVPYEWFRNHRAVSEERDA